MSKIGLIGTGVMRKSIIHNMMKNNLSVNVYNLTKSKTEKLDAERTVWYYTPKAIAQDSVIIF
ncbi:NAD(P)-binding domain-containing protein, partial [Enterococcus faecalis]|uniref:NAD(P)-binding domain-containing protein n=1 Tax=Enterococcus faecalis TaxID=1351 RepID=UPI003D6BE1D5